MPTIRGDSGKGKPIVRVALLGNGPTVGPVTSLGKSSALQMLECRALLDTGADGTSICATVAKTAGLQYVGKQPVIGISGLGYHRTWVTRLGFYIDQAVHEIGNPPQGLGNLFVLQEPFLAVQIPESLTHNHLV